MADILDLCNKSIFISYSTKNKNIAERLLKQLEKKGNHCFYAPRDISGGASYAGKLIKAIQECNIFLLILTQASADSPQVLREINAAVQRNKTIIPLQYEEVVFSDDLKYYLGVCQRIDMHDKNPKNEVSEIAQIIENKCHVEKPEVKEEIRLRGTHMKALEELLEEGVSVDMIAMREIEIDYLCIPKEKYTMNEELEGTLDDWRHGIECLEYETSACLVKNDNIIGYCDILPVTKEAYKKLVGGECIIRDDMIEVYGFGGVFPAYIAMLGIVPEEEGYANYYMAFDWIFQRIAYWRSKNIALSSLAISVYSDMLERFVEKLGFHYVGKNPIGGKIYEVEYEELINTAAVRYRYSELKLR